MFFSCEKLVLQSAVNTAARAVPSKSSIPALEGLLLTCRDQYLSITGIRTQIPCQDTQDGQMVLNARLLGDIIRRLPNDTISLSTEANSDGNQMAHIKCADASFHIAGIPADDYPELPEVEENESVQLPEQLLRQMIQQTSFAISTNEARPVHMGSLFEIIGDTLTIVSVDGFRLAMRREPIQTVGKSSSFVAPGTALNEMERICTDTDAPVNITVNSSDDAINAANGDGVYEGELDYSFNMLGGKVVINSNGDGIDSNGDVNLIGGSAQINSAAGGGEAGIDYDGQYYISDQFNLNNRSGLSGADMMPGQMGGMNGQMPGQINGQQSFNQNGNQNMNNQQSTTQNGNQSMNGQQPNVNNNRR